MATLQEENNKDVNTNLDFAKNITASAGVVNASDLTNNTQKVEVPTPNIPETPQNFAQSFDNVIAQSQAETDRRIAEARQPADDIFKQIQNIDNLNSQDLYSKTFGQQGGDKALTQLQDESTLLAKLQGKFRTQTNDLQTLAGQTKTGAIQDITEIDRRRAIEVGNQALLVQALQGNVATARQIAKDTVEFAFQDKQLELTNLKTQLEYASSIAGADETKLLEREKQKVDKEIKDLERTQNTIDSAITSGEASVDEMQQLTNPDIDNKTKMALSQGIVARSQRINLALDRAIQNAQLSGLQTNNAIANEELKALRNPLQTNGMTPEFLDRLDSLPIAKQEALVNAREDVRDMSSLKTLIADENYVTLMNALTPEGAQFRAKVSNVIDKLARERTGAVIGADEMKNFKKILGLGFSTVGINPTVAQTQLSSFIQKGNESINLIDPRGDIGAHLDRTSQVVEPNSGNTTDSYLDEIAFILQQEDTPYSMYLTQ